MEPDEQEVRDLLRAYGTKAQPPPDQKAKTWTAIAAATGLGGAAASASAWSSTWTKVGFTTIALAILGGGAAWLSAGRTTTVASSAPDVATDTTAPLAEPTNSAPLEPEPAAVAMVETIEASDIAPPRVEPAATRPRGARTAQTPREVATEASPIEPTATVAASGDTTSEASSLAAELALLREAQRALASHDSSAALAALDRHEAEFPRGALAHERDVARIAALCEDGRRRDAAHVAARAEQRPAIARALSRCGGASP